MIEARGLVKRYGPTTAVDHLSFDVRPGTVTGFLGPNGAGKSTTMRMMLGLDRPDAGTATINGQGYRDMRSPLRDAAALLGDPAVLLLDEPVNGLDPEGIRWIRNLLKSLAAHGRTVLISSHLISEVAQTADQLIVIGQGRLLAQTTVAELARGDDPPGSPREGISARSNSLEEAFFALTEGSTEYSARNIAYHGSLR